MLGGKLFFDARAAWECSFRLFHHLCGENARQKAGLLNKIQRILKVFPFVLSMRASRFFDCFEKCDSHPVWKSHVQSEFSGGELLRCRNVNISLENIAKTGSEWHRSIC